MKKKDQVFLNSLTIAINSAQIFIMRHGSEIPDTIYANYLNHRVDNLSKPDFEYYKNYTA